MDVFQRLGPVARRLYAVIRQREDIRDDFADCWLVVHHKDVPHAERWYSASARPRPMPQRGLTLSRHCCDELETWAKVLHQSAGVVLCVSTAAREHTADSHALARVQSARPERSPSYPVASTRPAYPASGCAARGESHRQR